MATPTSSADQAGGAEHVPPGPLSTPAILSGYVLVGCCLLGIGSLVRRISVAGKLEDGRALPDDLLGADQFVDVASIAVLLGVVVAAVLVGRWLRAVRANRAPLADPGLRPGAGAPWTVRAWWVVVPVAVVGFALTRLLLGEADTPADRQTLDLVEISGTLLVAAAAGLTIAVVSAVTARQQAAARVGGVAVRAPVLRRPEARESGLQVVREGDRPGSNPPGDGASGTGA